MIKYLLPKNGKFYKANLHTHSTVSDGRYNPEEVKQEYLKRGYSIVAFTDHEVMVSHKELKDKNFLPLIGMEIGINDKRYFDNEFNKNYHLNLIAEKEENLLSSAFNSKYIPSNLEHTKKYITEDMEKFSDKTERVFSQKYVNDVIKNAKKEGFLVTLNHPVWSMLNYDDYKKIKGLFGIEVNNGVGDFTKIPENGQAYFDMLSDGKKVLPISADDMHHKFSLAKHFIVVKAKNLEYNTVIKALKKGDFYSSNGPEIKELYFDNVKMELNIKTSDVYSIAFKCNGRKTKSYEYNNGENLTVNGAVFNIKDYVDSALNLNDINSQYIYAYIVGMNGEIAMTRAYYLKDLLKK